MWRRGPTFALLLVSITLCPALVSLAPGQDSDGIRDRPAPPSPEQVNRAIDAGILWLKARQRADGSWGPCTADQTYDGFLAGKGYETGPTSFAVFTLTTCGVSKSDGTIKKALKWLRTFDRNHRYTSYESSSLVLMLTALNKPKKRPVRGLQHSKNPLIRPPGSRFTKEEWRWMGRHAKALARHQTEEGGFGYWGSRGYADVSATQFAILALRAASRAGYPVERVNAGVWDRAVAYLGGLQGTEGGFPYHKDVAWSAGMTAAGLSSLLICREQMALLDSDPPAWLDETVAKAFSHLGKHFDPSENRSPDPGRYHYCYLYAVERVGMLSGRRELGGKDWYVRGAKWLLEEQKEDGRWVDRTCMRPEDVLGTCFALLFLKRATVPVITPSDD
jgi:hypothetical protein